jgi:sulfoacetaldehyde acetyltransferase
MADGYARVSGRHGVCIGQNGPGVTNFVTAIAAAYWAHSPVVAITPEAGTTATGLGGFQEIEQLKIFEAITKYQAHVNNPSRMAELTSRAFDRAFTDLGPTQLNIPRDHFYGEIETAIHAPLRVSRGPGSSADLDAAADLLASAEFPVILSGGGVVAANGVGAVVALAERLGAPVANSYLHNDSFPASHDLACGPIGYHGSKAAMTLLSRADVVVALGSRLGPFGTLPQYEFDYWPKTAKLIQVDADASVLGLVKRADVTILGDAREAAMALEARLAERTLVCAATRDARADAIRTEKETWRTHLETWNQEQDAWSLEVAGDSSAMHPRAMLRELQKALPGDAMVSTDIGNICQIANSYLGFDAPRSMFGAMMFGNCGYAFPAMVGCKVAAPERPAVVYVGDGAWGMSFGEILTCVRERIPVTVVVFNNGQWGAEKKNQVDFYSNRFLGVNLENASWAGIARAMGAEGVTIEKASEVGPALADACKAQSDGKTTVLEMMVTRELGDPFRRDALKRPHRLLEKYRAYSD